MVTDLLGPPVGRDSMRNNKRQEAKSLMTDKRLTDSIDFVLPNSHISSQRTFLFVFEDSDEVIKMIMKGRSPSVRHNSRTHRVNLDWLFGRKNVDLGIHVTSVNTSTQIADILTEGSFTWKDGRRSHNCSL